MVQTNGQKMAEAAYARILERKPDREFTSFARSFPSLIHSSGLAQAVVFARAKGAADKGKKRKPPGEYLEDLATVLAAIGHAEAGSAESLERATRELSVAAYVRLSRNALQAAGWLKRFVEAAAEE